ncbi:hypothetical protein HPP92_018575 [Vanilla planifolia]|uniref:Uncharacterized protein n=1 Tax=Vanilla planifolia TaxID=51239 RepID=A0A835QA31_VANPL|nr:hypothetical protein HPP92_018575 [Vanilla planifolia]
MESVEISGAAIAKRLASCNQSSRHRAVRLLCSWLPNLPGDSTSAEGVTDAELLKIWKGLFFCVWHSDKLPAQVELIGRLATLLSSLSPPLASRYLDAFLVTIRREWNGIDYLRLNKFYLLIRRFLRHFFLLLKENLWNLHLTQRLVNILLEGSLLSADKFIASGVNYHIAEIFLDEIVEFLPLAMETLDLLLKPFLSVMQTTKDKVLVDKIKVNVFDRLAENGSKLLKDLEAGNAVGNFGKIALAMGFSKRFFDLASAAETQQGSRKVLFGLHDRYLRLEKELEKSQLDISLEHLNDGSLLQGSECVLEAAEVFSSTSGGNDDKQCDSKQMKKKRKKEKKMEMKMAENASNGAKVKSKTKKKKKNTLDSSVECVDTETGSYRKKNKNKNIADKPNGDKTEAAVDDAICNLSNENGNGYSSDNDQLFSLDDTLLSNLQKQFEKVAAEAGMACGSQAKVLKRKKRSKNIDGNQAFVSIENVDDESNADKSVEGNNKKVRFAMNNNLIWKPQNPLPPQSVRLPPSVTPRGSALKKGLSPGPIRTSPPTIKKLKVKGSSVKKGVKTLKTVSPQVKRLRFLQGLSM